jgi:hypothetical protein
MSTAGIGFSVACDTADAHPTGMGDAEAKAPGTRTSARAVFLIAALCIALVLAVNVLAGGGTEGLVEAAYTKCAAEGRPRNQLWLARFDYQGGTLGLGASGSVVFWIKDSHPLKTVRVDLARPANLFGWHVVGYSEQPAEARN